MLVETNRMSRWTPPLGAIASVGLHLAIFFGANLVLTAPDTGFEFEVPLSVEFGMAEATEVATEAPASGSPPQPAGRTSTSNSGEDNGTSGDAGVPAPADAGTIHDQEDAAATRPRRPRDLPEAPANVTSGEGDSHQLVSFLPAGAQLALRVDMDRVRQSPIATEVRRLVAVLPDWMAILGDSEIDPVRDLSRVLIATPDLRRSSLIIAGALNSEADPATQIAERYARVRGVSTDWQNARGIPTLAWPSPDATAREIALVGDRHFVLARPSDLPRVLALAASRRQRQRNPAAPIEALLALEGDEGVSIEVENAPIFVRRSPCGVPIRFRIGLTNDERGIEVDGRAEFAEAQIASEARTCMENLARRLSGNVIVALYGLDGPLDRLELSTEQATLRARTSLRYAEVSTILRLVRGLLAPDEPTTPPSRTHLPPPVPPPSPFE